MPRLRTSIMLRRRGHLAVALRCRRPVLMDKELHISHCQEQFSELNVFGRPKVLCGVHCVALLMFYGIDMLIIICTVRSLFLYCVLLYQMRQGPAAAAIELG